VSEQNQKRHYSFYRYKIILDNPLPLPYNTPVIIYTDHARLRLKQRAIEESQILETVSKPDEVLKSFEKRSVARKRFSGKILEVVFTKQNNDLVIITAYFLKEAK